MESQSAKRGITPPTVVVFLLAGVMIFAAGVILGGAGREDAKSVAPTTVVASGPVDKSTTEAPTTTVAEYVPVPTDFTIEVIELERSCFGSAGCNVTFRINPAYIGTAPTVNSYEVLYDIAGAKDPKSGSFTVTGDQVRHDERDTVQVPNGAVLTATATRVLA